MLEVSPYDSNTENTAYFAARTGSYLYANQPGRTLYLQLCWQKNQSNSFALTIWITDSTGSYLYANQPGRTLYLQLRKKKNPRQTVRKPWRKPETINNPVLCQGTR